MNITQVFSNSNNSINIFLHIVDTINGIHNFGENKNHSFNNLINVALTRDFLFSNDFLKKESRKVSLA